MTCCSTERVDAKKLHYATIAAAVTTRPAVRPTPAFKAATIDFVTAAIASMTAREPFALPRRCPKPRFAPVTPPILCSKPLGALLTLAPSAPKAATKLPALNSAFVDHVPSYPAVPSEQDLLPPRSFVREF